MQGYISYRASNVQSFQSTKSSSSLYPCGGGGGSLQRGLRVSAARESGVPDRVGALWLRLELELKQQGSTRCGCGWKYWDLLLGRLRRGTAETWDPGELRACRYRRRHRRRRTDSGALGLRTGSGTLLTMQSQQPSVFGPAVPEPRMHLVLLYIQPGRQGFPFLTGWVTVALT